MHFDGGGWLSRQSCIQLFHQLLARKANGNAQLCYLLSRPSSRLQSSCGRIQQRLGR